MRRPVALLLTLAGPALAAELRVPVQGMDCASCEPTVAAALQGLPFVSRAQVSFADGAACVSTSGPHDAAAIAAAIAAAGYTAGPVTEVASCEGPRKSPWAGLTEGVDAVVVSHGERVALSSLRVPGRITVVDVGAPWCGPCFIAARRLAAWLRERDDASVRVIELDAPTAEASFALPVARQHFAFIAGLPWLMVYDPAGKVLYKGDDVDAAIAAAVAP